MTNWQLGFAALVVGLYCWGTLIAAAAMTWGNREGGRGSGLLGAWLSRHL